MKQEPESRVTVLPVAGIFRLKHVEQANRLLDVFFGSSPRSEWNELPQLTPTRSVSEDEAIFHLVLAHASGWCVG